MMTMSVMLSGELFIILVTGVLAVGISLALDRLWAGVPVRTLYLFLRCPGVVLHECAHITGCIVTGAQVRNVVLFSGEGGSVTHTRPVIPVIGEVIISTAPLFLLPLLLSAVTWIFQVSAGAVVPAFPDPPATLQEAAGLVALIAGTFSENLVVRFNGWFLLYLYLVTSIILSLAPSTQDMRNAALGSILLVLAGALVLVSGFQPAIALLSDLVRLIGSGFFLGLVFGLVALAASLPLLVLRLFFRPS